MALVHQRHLPKSFHSIRKPNLKHHSSNSCLVFRFNTQKLAYCLCATSPNLTSQSPSPIFLSFLEEEEEEEEEEVEEEEVEEEEVEEVEEEEVKGAHGGNKTEDWNDPLFRFFKYRASTTQDPLRKSKLSLQKNRRSSWHLAPDSEFSDEAEIILDEEKEQLGSVSQYSTALPDGLVGDIVRSARNLPQNTTLGEALGDLEGEISEKECVEVLRLLGEENLVVCCLYFFEWMGLQEPSLVTPRAYSFLFPLLGRAGMGERIMLLFKNLPLKKGFQDVHVYNSAMSGLMVCKRYNDACKVYEAMETNNVHPDHVTCSIMITVMRKIGRSAKDSWDYFEKMRQKGVKWSPEVLGALIKSFCDEGLMSQAIVIQLEMEKKGVALNAIMYNTVMDAFSKLNRIEEAEGLFAEMRAKGVKPTSATFNILMDAYSRRIQPEIVENLLVEMKNMGLEPNVKSYTCLISAYGRQKKMSDMAADAFLRMKKNGIRPTSHSYTALIHAYSVSGWHEKAYSTFEKMLREGLKPSIETYTTLLDAFRRAGDTATLMKIWKLMIREKIVGTRVTFNILLDGFAKQGHYVEARDVICEFDKIGLQPTVMTYNMLMNAYARGGQHLKMPQLLQEMAARELKPDSVTYSTMIYAFVRVRDFKRAFFYHKKMVKSGQVPDVKSYQKLRAILDVKLATKNKKDKSAILGIINSKMGMVKAKKKGKKDEFWKNKIKHVRTQRVSPREQTKNETQSLMN